jgi:hypothetical protein
MAFNAVLMPLSRPAPVAVHDDGDMLRQTALIETV